MFQDCSLNRKITLKEFWHSLKCFEEGKGSTSSFDDLADRGRDKGEEEWSLRTFPRVPWQGLCFHHRHITEWSQLPVDRQGPHVPAHSRQLHMLLCVNCPPSFPVTSTVPGISYIFIKHILELIGWMQPAKGGREHFIYSHSCLLPFGVLGMCFSSSNCNRDAFPETSGLSLW